MTAFFECGHQASSDNGELHALKGGLIVKLAVATTAHLASDPRVRFKIVASLLAHEFVVSWFGPKATEGAPTAFDEGESIEFEWLPSVVGRRDRILNAQRLRGLLRGQREKIDWIYAPDPDAAWVALRVAPELGARVWFDIHEHFHIAATQRWFGITSPIASWGVEVFIKRLAEQSDLVTTVSPLLAADYGPRGKEIGLLPNSVPRKWLGGLPQDSRPASGDGLRLYCGKVGRDRGTSAVLRAARLLEEQGQRVTLVISGERVELLSVCGSESLNEPDGPAGGVRLEFQEVRPHREMMRLIGSCHASFVGYTGPAAVASLPNRFFETLALGVPPIVPSASPAMVDLIRKENCGFVCDFTSPESIAELLEALIREPSLLLDASLSAVKAFDSKLAWEPFMDEVVSQLRS